MSCSSRTACTAVGWWKHGALVARWNGRSWSSEQPARFPGASTAELDSVSCPSRSDCTAVGTGGKNRYLAEHWNGARWSVQRTPYRFPDLFMWAVSCTSNRFCMWVGYKDGPAVAIRWNGVNWSMRDSGLTAPGAALNGVSCWSARGCVAVGGGFDGCPLVERWDGTRWTSQPTPVSACEGGYGTPESVSCSSSTRCLAVGDQGGGCRDGGCDLPLALWWNGRTWSEHDPPFRDNTYLRAVSCAPDTCTATNYSNGPAGIPPVWQWNGKRWSHPPSRFSLNVNTELADVSCPARKTCIAVGSKGSAVIVAHGP